jgi:hypothetical protein
MSDRIRPPAVNPCGSCPYRRDVPSGVWDESEYEKLPHYDGDTSEQPPSVFMCHQQNGRLCSGWVGCHDMYHNLGLRVAALDRITPDDLTAVLEYTTSVPLFASGAEAAAHGMAEVESPPNAATKIIDKLQSKRERGAT